MKTTRLLILLAFVVLLSSLSNSLNGQTYSGHSTSNGYLYTLTIDKDSNVFFKYRTPGNYVYAEHTGRIKKINDSVFHVSVNMTIGQFSQKAGYSEMVISIDSAIEVVGNISVKYFNGNTKEICPEGKTKGLIRFKPNYEWFSNTSEKKYLTFCYKKGCSNGSCQIYFESKIDYGSEPHYTAGEKVEFDIIMKSHRVWTVGEPPLQTGHFKLHVLEQ